MLFWASVLACLGIWLTMWGIVARQPLCILVFELEFGRIAGDAFGDQRPEHIVPPHTAANAENDHLARESCL